ncbi:MAG: hypothetical protein AB8B55_00330 [Mariniblastus sp.]
MGHFRRNISTQQAESEADQYAARTSSPQAVQAAQRFFASGGGATRVHGSSQQRYARVSGAAGNMYSGYRASNNRSPARYSSGTRGYSNGTRVYVKQNRTPSYPQTRYVVRNPSVVYVQRSYRSPIPTRTAQPVRSAPYRHIKIR